MAAGFEIDVKAFRAQNIGRQPQQLIREAIQNAFDERPAHVIIDIHKANNRGVVLTVIDDGPGFTDEKDIWTLFASDKRKDPSKRGRLGRGLKELISVAASCEVVTANKRVVFAWNRQSLTRTLKRQLETVGTKLVASIPSWKSADVEKITNYLRLFVPPEGTSMVVNGVHNKRLKMEYSIPAIVETITYGDDEVPIRKHRHTTLQLYSGGEKWIYEMGIPIERISEEDGFEWSIDVGQRCPLRPERDMLPRNYVHSLYAAVANELMTQLPQAELTDLWMEEAVGNYNFEKNKVGKVYVERRFGQNAARAIVNDTHDRNLIAINEGLNLIKTEQLSASVRNLVRENVPSTAELYPVKCAPAKFIHESEWTEGEKNFVGFSRWLAVRVMLPEPRIIVVDAPQASCLADSGQSGTSIRINRPLLGSTFFDRPRLASWIPLIIHELAHRTGEGHDAVYWQEFERLTGEVTQAIRDRIPELEQFKL